MAEKLSTRQIVDAAYSAGFRGKQLVTAVAVALAESAGDPRAHYVAARDNSYGLWQINMIGALGPGRRTTFGLTSNEQLFDPVINARAAYIVSGGGDNWRLWATYTSGDYRKYRATAVKAVAERSRGPIEQLVDAGTGAAGRAGAYAAEKVTDALGDLAGPLVKGLGRIAIIGIAATAGVALIVVGSWRGVKGG